jgi:hypothetical protein
MESVGDNPELPKRPELIWSLTLLAFTVSFFELLAWTAVINNLPRHAQGESVAILTFRAWVMILVIISVLIPGMVFRLISRSSKLRMLFVLLMALAVVTLYFLVFDDLLDKAWRRGL